MEELFNTILLIELDLEQQQQRAARSFPQPSVVLRSSVLCFTNAALGTRINGCFNLLLIVISSTN